MPKISVLMSVRNGENDLHKSIPSILNQSFKDFEFIICDDGSSDNTYKITPNMRLLERVGIMYSQMVEKLRIQ